MDTQPAPERAVRFLLLGAFRGWHGEERLHFGGVLKERVLAALLLEGGRVVPVSRLVTAGWPQDPPASAPHQVRKAVADLRRRVPGGARRILTDGPGYRIDLARARLDLDDFRAGVLRARGAVREGRPDEGIEELRAALRLWRGPLPAGRAAALPEPAALLLEEERLSAMTRLTELRLARGEATQLVGELRELVALQPLREATRGQLMLALYRSGRQAEALEEYHRLRTLLAEELGIDPGTELARLHQDILHQRPRLAAPAPPAADRAPALPSASGALPHDLPDFAGRTAELDRLERAAARGGVVAVDGMGGSGKTSLAVRVAHRVAAGFPDGGFFLDLRGFTPEERPLTAHAALESLLRQAGVPPQQVPGPTEGRIALWRSLTADRRVLVLLDNASGSEQIRPALPSPARSLVLVTSRTRLVDLDGAQWLSLDALSQGDGMEFLRRTLGDRTVAREPEACAELVALCGHLPLALRLATARLRNRSRWTVGYLVGRLRDESRRLHELSAGGRGVAPALRLSYEALKPSSRTALRLLARHPGRRIDPHAAAALLNSGAHEAEQTLEDLLDAHFLEQREPGLYQFHDLVRSFARGLGDEESAAEDTLAVRRLLTCFADAADRACDVLFPGRERAPGLTPGAGPATGGPALPAPADTGQALDWFDRNREDLLEAVSLAHRQGWDTLAVRLPHALSLHASLQSYPDPLLEANRIAAGTARRLGDPVLLRTALQDLALTHWGQGGFDEGLTLLEESGAVARASGDVAGEAMYLSRLGQLCNSRGELPRARELLTRAAAAHRRAGDQGEEAFALAYLGSATVRLRQYSAAAEAARRAVGLCLESGREHSSVAARFNLSLAMLGMDRPEEALEHLRTGLGLSRGLNQPTNTAVLLACSAEALLRLGRVEEAGTAEAGARELTRLSGPRALRATVDNALGRLGHARGDHRQAMARHTSAYRLATEIGHRYERARALEGMADAAGALGDPAASGHQTRARDLYLRMGVLPAP